MRDLDHVIQRGQHGQWIPCRSRVGSVPRCKHNRPVVGGRCELPEGHLGMCESEGGAIAWFPREEVQN